MSMHLISAVYCKKNSIKYNIFYPSTLLACFASALLLAGCKEFIAETPISEIVIPNQFDNSPAIKKNDKNYTQTEWWKSWKNPNLNYFISTALYNNLDISIAKARVIEARSGLAITEGKLLPTVGIKSSVGGGPIEWYSPGKEQGRTLDAYLAGITGTWEPDLFGGRADDSAAAHYDELAVQEQLRGVQLLVATELAHNYLSAVFLMKRELIINQTESTLENLLTYTTARFNAGQAQINDADVIREKIHEIKSTKEPLRIEIESRKRRIAVLSGETPENMIINISDSGIIVPNIPLGVMPSEVLLRRPDIRARLDAVNAQLSRLNSAKKDLLPRFQINFFAGSGKLQIGGLPTLEGLGSLASLTVYLPIFTAGRIEANIALNDARLQSALAEYNKSLIQSLEDVENSYGIRLALDRRIKELKASVSTANKNSESTYSLYLAGHKTLGDVLNSRLDALQKKDQYILALSECEAATIRLYASLGGGW
jgi:NodT family efflux transporter outer membrane factor (OMF) lipoprotein